MMSDPHIEQWRERYFLDQGLDYILALYYQPTLRHFERVPPERIIYFPWAVPEDWIGIDQIAWRGQKEVMIFGAAKSDAYTTRNWCRRQPGVRSFDHSGVENKVLEARGFFEWLTGFDAVIAAGSEHAKYRLTTPKYFEIAAAGGLLLAQETDDLDRLGFVDGENCLVFSQTTFRSRVDPYLAEPGHRRWLQIRRAGRELVRRRHTTEHRVDTLKAHVQQWKGRRKG
jgi:hypothetical protein